MAASLPGPSPRLAVLLCTHNGERFLPQQLESLWAQTLPPAGVFVHDWASRDATLAVLNAARQQVPAGCAWELMTHDTAPGPGRSFLAAVRHLMASPWPFDYLLFCDQDDVWHPDKLARFAQAIADQPSLDLVYCDVELIDETGRQLAPTYLGPGGAFGRPMDVHHPATLFVNTVSGMSMAVSRRLLHRGAAAWALPDWFMHDWAMTIFACITRAPVHFIPHSLVSYRQHGGNLVGGVGGSPARGLAALLKQAREDVRKTHRQYLACLPLADPTLPGLPGLGLGRFGVAWTILRGRSFRPLKTLKVALGYALFWPGRG